MDTLPTFAPLEDYDRLATEHGHLAVARAHSFLDWPSLVAWVEAATAPGSAVGRFERAVDAVVDGDVALLRSLLALDPSLPAARSTRTHRCTLLHYVAANGVEQLRQRTPPTAVEVATELLRAGAEVDAEADLYGGCSTTMGLLVSSAWPARAGLMVPLVETLAAFGASMDGALPTALAFGYLPAARALVRLGAPIGDLPCAAGLGELDLARERLPSASPEDRHQALALAAQLGQVEVVRLLLDAGEDPSRYNPPRIHSHSTPLHQAALAGHEAVVRLLVERGAALDLRDKFHDGTPAGWAKHGGQPEIAAWLSARR